MKVLKKTPFNKWDHDLNARMRDFAGWELPMWYSSILKEHKVVRNAVGMFDVSDMGRVWVTGNKAGAFLSRVLTRNAEQLRVGSAQLCLMCLKDGGILDDLLVYRLDIDEYLIVWNAGNTEQKLDWLSHWLEPNMDVAIEDKTHNTAMIAIQGPAVCQPKILKELCHLPHLGVTKTRMQGLSTYVARTGYTGEDGFEIITDVPTGLCLWQSFIECGVKPCGLGARDLLRLEAGMLLYGQDITTSTNPFEAGLGWLVDLGHDDFIGKSALLEIRRNGIGRKLVGFRMKGREIARSGYHIISSGQEVGRVTSGGYSPTLNANIGFGYVPIDMSSIGTNFEIVVRDRPVLAEVVGKRFYKREDK